MKWRDVPWSLKQYSAPSAEPLTYSEAKSWLRLPDDTDQTLVTAMIGTARRKVEEDTGRKLITQAWDYYLDAFPADALVIPTGPVASVTSIKTTTAAGVESTLAATNYQLVTGGDFGFSSIVLSDSGEWPSDLRAHQAIVIRLSLGYGSAGSNVPGPLVDAMRQLLTMWYGTARNQNGLVPPKWVGYDELIRPYRFGGIG